MFEEIKMKLQAQCPDLIKGVETIEVTVVPPRDNYVYALKGTIAIGDQEASVYIAFKKDFPIRKPDIFLEDRDVFGFIPHIEPDGFICYVHEEGLLLDQDNPFGIVKDSLARAIRTLEMGVSEDNYDDLYNEFEVYWARQKTKIVVDCILSLGERVKEIYVLYDPKLHRPVFIFDALDEKSIFYAKNLFHYDILDESIEKQKGIYIPLREGTRLLPPSYSSPWGFGQIKDIIFSNITSSNKRELQRILKQKRIYRNTKEYILLSVPQPNGYHALVGIELSEFKARKGLKNNKSFRHPLIKVQSDFKLTPLVLKRHHPSYLLQRTIGYDEIHNKHIAVIGLGAVGSRITMELARAGVSKFTLIDDDVLDIDNVFRHELGSERLYFFDQKQHQLQKVPKVYGMYQELKEKYPLIDVEPKVKNILDLIREDIHQFEQFDLIIVAIGNPTVERYFNRVVRTLTDPPPVIFTWLEPLGIGGHALLTLNNGNNGCYECLYTNPFDPDCALYNKASFAAPNQFFGKMISGCQTAFTPYGSMDALQTAILATRLALSVLTGKEKDNPLCSWKGDSTDFLEHGFKLSKRYELTTEQLNNTRYHYKAQQCPICGQDGGS
ncbi:E2/UBC family protein [Geobacillus sp. WSUCF-018B]|uniref:ThiF family adenylyltransferase n=1 Tax=Geobacillus sp. WSUCF-018B TaxID=2055939 RepID=UPI00130469BE|nr:E2/UBC family protein [Geobacillus sp. WSUCF-018B]